MVKQTVVTAIRVVAVAAIALALVAIGFARAEAAAPPITADVVFTSPTCSDPAITIAGRYGGPDGAELRLQRLTNITEGYVDYIDVHNEGVLVLHNGAEDQGFDKPLYAPHVLLNYGDTFSVSQFNRPVAPESAVVYRATLLLPSGELLIIGGPREVTFPVCP